MAKVDRCIVVYNMGLQKYQYKIAEKKKYDLVGEINKILNYIVSLSENERKLDYASEHKVLYMENFSKDSETKNYNIEFISAKYNQVREVIDTETLESKGKLKKRRDGDKEKTHISISFDDNDNAICAFECNYYGVGMSKIIDYFNTMSGKFYFTEEDRKYYKITYEIIPNDEFLKTLAQMKKISIARFIIDKEDLNTSDFKDLAGRRDIRNEVELTVKSIENGGSIRSKTIEEYYSKKNKNNRIKRILVNGERSDGKIFLDTERMKTRHTIYAEVDDTGVVNAKSIFDEFKKILPQSCF